MRLRRIVRQTYVADHVLDYALSITMATRKHDDLELGASPRASISLVRCAQARALLDNRDFVVPDDVKALAVEVLAHRVVPVAGMRLERGRGGRAVAEVLERTPVPVTRA